MIKYVLVIVFVMFSFGLDINAQPKMDKMLDLKTRKYKKKQFIDLEGLDIQGMIDRPQTLYILKKSTVDFYESLDKYDYMKAIIDSTYEEPF